MTIHAKSKRVLVVDDCREDSDVVGRYLDQDHYEVQVVDTAEAGLRRLAEEPFDCVIVDYELPDASGVDFLAEIPVCDRPAVVMVTGRGDEATAVRALKSGAQDYLVKGDFSRVRLQQAVSHAIDVMTMRAEVQARRQELEHFAFTTAHDIKAPLRRVRSLCDLVLQDAAGGLSEECRENLELMSATVQQMAGFVDDMLELGRIGGRPGSWEDVDLRELADSIRSDFEVVLEEVGGSFEHGELPVVRAERALLRRLLQNLLDNAIKYRSERALRVRLAAEEAEGGWVLSLSDNGQGIPAKNREGIFDMFVRLHGDSEAPGAGLGLTICKRVAERHQGRLWVESEEGAGSTFKLFLPGPEAAE